MGFGLILFISLIVISLGTIIFFFSRYQKCPSDRILVIYGKTGGGGRSSLCMHGGAAFVWPVIQAFEYLDLTPIEMNVPAKGVRSKGGGRVDASFRSAVGISTESGVMENAAEHLLGLEPDQVRDLAEGIILSQLSHLIASMDIEQIDAGPDELYEKLGAGIESQLRGVGLKMIYFHLKGVKTRPGSGMHS